MINKTRTTLMLLLVSLYCIGQELPTEKSPDHIHIKGTTIFMIPPPSFENTEDFKGLKNPNDPTAMIMVVEVPGPFSEVTKGFNPEMMKQKGMELKSKVEVDVAGVEGLFLEVDQLSSGIVFSKKILVFGDEKFTRFVNGTFIQDSVELGKKIEQSILTTVVDDGLGTNPRDFLNYSVDEGNSGLQFHSVISNGMLFNRDLKVPTESIDQVMLITDRSYAKVDIVDRKAFCKARLKQYPDEYIILSDEAIKEIEIDQLKGFELTARNKNNGREEMYQVILFDDAGNYYVFVGMYLIGHEKALTDVKSVINTFKRKK